MAIEGDKVVNALILLNCDESQARGETQQP
jgi:hypothetical protein